MGKAKHPEKCMLCGKPAYLEKKPEGQTCEYCDRWICDKCTDWELMKIIGNESFYCVKCGEEEAIRIRVKEFTAHASVGVYVKLFIQQGNKRHDLEICRNNDEGKEFVLFDGMERIKRDEA